MILGARSRKNSARRESKLWDDTSDRVRSSAAIGMSEIIRKKARGRRRGHVGSVGAWALRDSECEFGSEAVPSTEGGFVLVRSAQKYE
jgi:hypothetical protein